MASIGYPSVVSSTGIAAATAASIAVPVGAEVQDSGASLDKVRICDCVVAIAFRRLIHLARRRKERLNTQRFRVFRVLSICSKPRQPFLVVVNRNRHGGKNTDNDNHNQKLDQGEAGLSSFLQSYVPSSARIRVRHRTNTMPYRDTLSLSPRLYGGDCFASALQHCGTLRTSVTDR